jgi:hypothetical protein
MHSTCWKIRTFSEKITIEGGRKGARYYTTVLEIGNIVHKITLTHMRKNGGMYLLTQSGMNPFLAMADNS